MPNLEKIKEVMFGPKPLKTPRYEGVPRQWGWSTEFIYRWRNTTAENLERRFVASFR
ncbi:MAG: hypothetical protein PHW53_03025 [Patescibacteria group bacterium]|nr:hypothetical protein [Patescibacteria group bacterium]